ncbi:MAG: type 1 periplasmic binding fold superfamily protein [Saprospiraceae bacterium]|jgi:hypothetical protein|nr:type 1 periplasmic binding fold superfamily protein [Saprospiraceae bacterium]
MKNNFIILSVCILGIQFLVSCEKNPVIPNEEELITTLSYTLIPETGGSNVTFSFQDIDGVGGNPPLITYVGALQNNTTYNGELTLKNEFLIPSVDITEEILKEADFHQLFYSISGNGLTDLSIIYDDNDANNYPVGLKTKVKTSKAGNGKLRITLRHLPFKSAPGVISGDISNAGGETDIEVDFDIIIK